MTWKEKQLYQELIELRDSMEKAHGLADGAEKEVLETFGDGNNDFIHGCKLVTRMWAEKLSKIISGSPIGRERAAGASGSDEG